MNTQEKTTSIEQAFSNLSAEDLENLEVEELEQRLELATIDYMISAGIFTADKLTPDVCKISKMCLW